MTVAEGGGIFVSYRRQESSHLAGRLYDRLADRFGEGQVFIDVDAIEPGVDFAEEICRAVAACKVLLAIIGPTWLTATDERGRRRLDDPDDIVRLEIEAALARGVRVIPILVEGAVMPGRQICRRAWPVWPAATRCSSGMRASVPTPGAWSRRSSGCWLQHPAPPQSPALPALRLSDLLEMLVGEVAQKGSEPARSDLARAARLLADAERIANSITDEYSKASALSGVAKALAATDPDRAARLFADAERIANSITDESSKASALSGIAEALAATDPDRAARLLTDAERIANSITDESSKAAALSGVAKALAATDPDRAERIANSITDSSKAAALSGVAEALARRPDRAARLPTPNASPTPSPTSTSKAAALSGVAKALAATDPDRAERIASSITDESSKAAALSDVAEALAATDPDRAERIARLHHRRVLEGSGAERRRGGAGSHRPRPRRPAPHRRRTHRQLHHRRVLRRHGR